MWRWAITKSPRDSAAAPGGVEISFPVTVSLLVMMAVRALDQPAVPGVEVVELEQPAAVVRGGDGDSFPRIVEDLSDWLVALILGGALWTRR